MSKIEVNTVAPQCGTTLTLGESGDTVTLGAGASQSGFGRTGTVDWQTGSIKTSTFTAANGEGYFANTTGSAFTMNLPSSPSAGNIVSVKDYAQTFETNNLTVGRGGSNIEGVANDIILDANGESITLVYVDATKGWVLVGESLTQYGPEYIAATGGTITTCGNFKIHTFTGPGTFQVTNAGNSGGSDKVSYVVIAGGGGAGGFREGKDAPTDSYSASPLATTGLTTPATSYPITVGGGGAGGAQPAAGAAGVNSVFSTITSTGGGIGGGRGAAGDGGSGGGGQRGSPQTAGSGNTPPVSPAQGTNGGPGGPPNGGDGTGGGGGATTAGSVNATCCGGAGGAGAISLITGTPVARAGGGGGGATPAPSTKGAAGNGGGGAGAGCGPSGLATNGTANTGGGGGGSSGGPGIPITVGGSGGSGVVIIRYKFQN